MTVEDSGLSDELQAKSPVAGAYVTKDGTVMATHENGSTSMWNREQWEKRGPKDVVLGREEEVNTE
ncbi:MAG: hypothetical protein ABSA81_03080 [Candidatus Bathyarchaeia archaeon]|jgi:hypothetical protein